MLTKDMIMQELDRLETLRQVYENVYISWDNEAEAIQAAIHDDEAMLIAGCNNNNITHRLDKEYAILENYMNIIHEYGDKIAALDRKIELLTKLADEYE